MMLAVKQIPWLRVVVEGAVIVISILLAFAVDATWDARQARALERDALQRLDAEFAQIDPVLVRWQGHHVEVLEASMILLKHAAPDAQPGALTEDSIARLISPIRFVWTVDPPLATLNALESSGRLAAIRSQELLTQLASWRALLVDLQGDELRLSHRVEASFIPFLQSRIAYRTLTPTASAVRDRSAFPADLSKLLADREFEGMIDEQRDRAATIIENYDSARTSVARSRALIRAALGN
jgi:hypothetical protein